MIDNNDNSSADLPEFMGYPTFADVQNGRLRAYNRLVMFIKIFGERGEDIAKQYIAGFSDREKKVIRNIKEDIANRGMNIVRLEIQENRSYA